MALIEAWFDRFDEMMFPMDDSIQVLSELHQREVPIYALSNWGAETFEIALDHYPFLDWFDGLVISGRVGMAKPDARIFQHLLEEHDLDVSDVVFVDDHLPNVEAATRLGMDVVHFSSAGQPRGDLGQHGFL